MAGRLKIPGKPFSVSLSVEGCDALAKLLRRDRTRRPNLVIDWALRTVVDLTNEAPKPVDRNKEARD